MNCTTDLIQDTQKLTFATYARGHIKRALPVSYSVGVMEREPKRTDMEDFIAYQREMYAVTPQIEQADNPVPAPVDNPPAPETRSDEPPAGGDW